LPEKGIVALESFGPRGGERITKARKTGTKVVKKGREEKGKEETNHGWRGLAPVFLR
jgi:hypothetical protein